MRELHSILHIHVVNIVAFSPYNISSNGTTPRSTNSECIATLQTKLTGMAPKQSTPRPDLTNDSKVYSMKSLSALSEMFLYCYLGMTLTVTHDSYVCSLLFFGVAHVCYLPPVNTCVAPSSSLPTLTSASHLSKSLRNTFRHSWGLSFLTLLACLVGDA